MNKLIYLCTLLLVFSCEKQKLPELPESNDPMFGVDGTIDGQSISISAGTDDYYMQSEEFEFNNVTQWKGNLTNSENQFEFILSDGIIDVPNSTFDLSDVDYIGLTEVPSQPLLQLSKDDLTNGEFIQSITWIVDGEAYSNQGPLVIFEPGEYTICAEVTFTDQTEASSCSDVILGYDKNAKGELKFIVGQNNRLLAFFDTPEYEIDHVEWYYNDSLISANKVNLSIEANTNTFDLKAIVHYSNGVVRERSVFVNKLVTTNFIQDLTAFENQSNVSWDFKLRMNIAFNGQHYTAIESTAQATQLEIISISQYGYNANGEQVLLIKGNLQAPFYHQESQSEVNANLTLSFALPYK